MQFFTRKCVTHHSCQLVEYCSWNVFCQQICNISQRIQLVQRDETDLCQLLNPRRPHLQVFCSASWPKTLYDGLGAAAVRPNFNLTGRALLCSNRCFTYNASMQPCVIALASDSAEDSDTVACVPDHCGTVKHGPIANTPPDVEHLVFGSPAQSASTVTWLTSSSFPTQENFSAHR